MANQNLSNTPQPSDEIDLGQLFQLIGRGFNKLFEVLLLTFLYLKKNLWKLLSLIVIGLIAGIGLNKIVSKKYKTEIIVKPNMESKEYLYGVVSEIDANIKAKDTTFFENLGIEIESIKSSEINVTAISSKENDSNGDNLEYLELLQNFENAGLVSDVLRAEILKKSSLDYKITFSYKELVKGHENAEKLIKYINSNEYYGILNEVRRENATGRIKKNGQSIIQIDELISNFSEKLRKDTGSSDGKIILDSEEKLNVTGLLALKNDLIKDIETRKEEIIESNEVVSVINFGRPQLVEKSFFGKKIVLIPVILIVLFFLFSFFKYINKKALELQS